MILRQCLEHRENRGSTDAGADEQHGCICPIEDEGATGRCDLDCVADREPAVEISAGGAVVFALDGDPVVAGAGRSGERVVPEHRGLPFVGRDSEREVLAWARGWERWPAGG